MRRRVVVTGLGAVTPVGNDVATTWQALLAGKSGAANITKFDATNFSVRFAAEVKGFDALQYMDRKEAKRSDLYTQYAIAASVQAMKDAGLEQGTFVPEDCGVIIGSGIGGLKTFEEQHDVYRTHGPNRISPFFIPMFISDIAAGVVSMRLGAKGPNYATVSACATSAHAIGDAYHLTGQPPEHEGLQRSMRKAMADGRVGINDVQYINAHGTSTPLNDPNESKAIKAVFGEQAFALSVSSTKSATGHMLGAAGSVEFIACTLAIRDGMVPPTINYSTPDPECDLDYTPNAPRKRDIEVAMSNSSGFGGHNVSIAVRRWHE